MSICPDPIIKPLHSRVGRSGRSCGTPMLPITVYQGLGVDSKRYLVHSHKHYDYCSDNFSSGSRYMQHAPYNNTHLIVLLFTM